MRRLALACALLLLCGACAHNGANSGGDGGTGDGGSGVKTHAFRVSLSVSPFTGTMFKAGAVYTDGTHTASNAKELEALYMAHGANEVYARISCDLDPTGTPDDHSLTSAVAKAKLAKSLSLPFDPELGLWKHYGDISCQPPPDFSAYPSITLPAAWGSLTIDQMLPAFKAYGALVAQRITATGATVDIWDIGNEVDLGVAGVAPKGMTGHCATPYVAPDGVDPAIGQQTVAALLTMPVASRITWLKAHVWPDEAKILGAVAAGIKSVVPGARFETHMSQSRSPTFAVAFYQAMIDGGFSPDVLGFSYYPSASTDADKVKNFKATVLAVEKQFHRPAFVAEYAYPAEPITTGAYAGWNHAVPNYPVSPAGQAALLQDLAGWAYANGVAGIRPWAPEVFVPGWKGFALFDGTTSPATARTSLDSIAKGIANPDPAAFHD